MTKTPGGLVLPDSEDRHELGERGQANQPLPADAVGERFAVHLASGYFVTDAKLGLAELVGAHVLVTDKPLTTLEPLVAILEEVARWGVPLLICAPAITDDARLFLVVNQLRGTIYVAAVDADAPTRARIAAIAGTTATADLAVVTRAELGNAKSVRIAHDAMAIS